MQLTSISLAQLDINLHCKKPAKTARPWIRD